MTKVDLLLRYNELLLEKGLRRIDGIGPSSNKSEIQNAIACLECSDEMLDKYLTVIELRYPNMHRAISRNGDFKKHFFNRLYVFNTARQLLAD